MIKKIRISLFNINYCTFNEKNIYICILYVYKEKRERDKEREREREGEKFIIESN